MKKNNLESRLIGARPEHEAGSSSFVNSTMEKIKIQDTHETFSEALRKTNVTNKGAFKMKYEKLKWQFKQLPGYVVALIILGSVSSVGAAAYATYKWINPSVTITNVQPSNDDGKREYTVDSQCGELYSGKDLKYELAQDSGLSDEDVRKVFENTCAYNSLGSFIDSHWKSDNDEQSTQKKKVGDRVTIYDHSNSVAGSSEVNPAFGLTIGQVTELNNDSLSFELKVYAIENTLKGESIKYYPEGITAKRTVSLAKDLEVWSDGKIIKLGDIKIGDTVQLVNRTINLVQYYDDIKQNALGEQISFEVAGIIKTNIDTRYVASSGSQIGDPAIVNAIASLRACHGNEEYLCVEAPSQVLAPVYSTVDTLDGKENQKFLRKDIDPQRQDTSYMLNGRVLAIDKNLLTIETRGKKGTFTIELPQGAGIEYSKPQMVTTNTARATDLKLERGDLVQVYYIQAPDENHLTIKPGDVQELVVLMQVQPDGSLKKY